MPLSVQRSLFQPFLGMRGLHQKCSIFGTVNRELAKEVKVRMTPTVHWQRQQGWELFELLQFMLQVADS
jgi:hypothetical protein